MLVFFAAQFVAYFKYTNLGMILAIKGAEGLKASGLGPIPLMLSFILLSAALNLTMGSASAKWAFMAPVFVPMFMLLGYTPELVQGVYRIGDSSTNMISPMMSFFALIVAFVQKYDAKAGIGTVIATMLPYSVAFHARLDGAAGDLAAVGPAAGAGGGVVSLRVKWSAASFPPARGGRWPGKRVTIVNRVKERAIQDVIQAWILQPPQT